MKAAAMAAGKSELLDGFARDYPKGPHDLLIFICEAIQ